MNLDILKAWISSVSELVLALDPAILMATGIVAATVATYAAMKPYDMGAFGRIMVYLLVLIAIVAVVTFAVHQVPGMLDVDAVIRGQNRGLQSPVPLD
jgi:uncharacterized membrane protein